jgi:hypothetical protein
MYGIQSDQELIFYTPYLDSVTDCWPVIIMSHQHVIDVRFEFLVYKLKVSCGSNQSLISS